MKAEWRRMQKNCFESVYFAISDLTSYTLIPTKYTFKWDNT